MTRFARIDRSVSFAAKLTTTMIVCLGLYFGRAVLIPLGIAILLAFMLQPGVRLLRRWKFGNGLAAGTTVTLFFAVIAVVVWIILGQLSSFVSQIPAYRRNLVEKITDVRSSLQTGAVHDLKSSIKTIVKEVKAEEVKEKVESGELESAPVETAPPAPKAAAAPEEGTVESDWDEMSSAAGAAMEPLAGAGLVFLMVIMILLRWADLRSRLIGMIGSNLSATTGALDDAGRRLSRYLGTQLMVNAATGVIVWLGLTLIGVPYAGLVGLCAAVFRYIPYVGPVAAAVLPVLISLTTSAGWAQVAGVVLLFAVLELVLNNVVEPVLYGSRIGVSELGLILATMVWTLLWGPAGLVLAAPLTVCLVVLGENVPCMRILSYLLSDKSQLPLPVVLAQRMMAGDSIEARDLLEGSPQADDPAEIYDDVFLPAMGRARAEAQLGLLDADMAEQMTTALPELLAETGSGDADLRLQLPPHSNLEAGGVLAVWPLCELAAAAASLLPARLNDIPCEVEMFGQGTMAADAVRLLSGRTVLGICLLYLSSSDFARVSNIIRRLSLAMPGTRVAVAAWGGNAMTPADQQALASFGVSDVFLTPAELRKWLHPLATHSATLIAPDAVDSPVPDLAENSPSLQPV